MFFRVIGVWNSARSPSSGLRPPSPAAREKRFGAFAVGLTGRLLGWRKCGCLSAWSACGIRPGRPHPKMLATFSRGAGEAVWCVCCGFDRPPTGVEKVWMFLRVVGVWNSARSPSSGLRPPSPAVREKPFVRHRGTFVRFTRRFALQGGDCVIVFPRGRRVEVGPVALIRRCWPPSPAVREKRFGAITVWWSGSAGGSYQNGNRACVEANRWFSASRECPTPYSVGLLGASPSRAEAAHAFTRVVA